MKRQTRSDKSLGKEGNGNEKEKTPDIVATSENENSTPDGKDSGKKESEKENTLKNSRLLKGVLGPVENFSQECWFFCWGVVGKIGGSGCWKIETLL